VCIEVCTRRVSTVEAFVFNPFFLYPLACLVRRSPSLCFYDLHAELSCSRVGHDANRLYSSTTRVRNQLDIVSTPVLSEPVNEAAHTGRVVVTGCSYTL